MTRANQMTKAEIKAKAKENWSKSRLKKALKLAAWIWGIGITLIVIIVIIAAMQPTAKADTKPKVEHKAEANMQLPETWEQHVDKIAADKTKTDAQKYQEVGEYGSSWLSNQDKWTIKQRQEWLAVIHNSLIADFGTFDTFEDIKTIPSKMRLEFYFETQATIADEVPTVDLTEFAASFSDSLNPKFSNENAFKAATQAYEKVKNETFTK